MVGSPGVGFPAGCGCAASMNSLTEPEKSTPNEVVRFNTGVSFTAGGYAGLGMQTTRANGRSASGGGLGFGGFAGGASDGAELLRPRGPCDKSCQGRFQPLLAMSKK